MPLDLSRDWPGRMSQETILTAVTQFAWLLVGAVIVGMLARRIRIPYAVALVIGGLLVEESHIAHVPELRPDVVLFVFLPPLLFDAAFRLDARTLRIVLRPVLVLALPGTLATAFIVGALLVLVLGLSWPVGLLFGSIVAATDPVAVIGIFTQLHVPGRVGIMAEAESLINDGIAITLYTVFLELAVTGHTTAARVGRTLGEEVLGGLIIGAALGFVSSRLTRHVDDHLIEMTMSTALAYGSYLAANAIGGSGPLAVVAAGLIHGTYGRRIGMSERTRQILDDLWEYLGFIANSVVFLLVGFSVNLGHLANDAWSVAMAIVAVLLARVIVVEGPAIIIPSRDTITTRPERITLIWAGLRGALTIALALSLPATVPSRSLLITMAFGVVLFTLLALSLTLPTILRRVGLIEAK